MKYIFFLFLLASVKAFAQDTADVLIKHGKIIDGTGNPWYYGDVAIKDGKIFRTGNLSYLPARRVLDAAGLVIAPGFIDVHTHIEDDEVKNPYATNFIADGVTTVITGNCGISRVDLGAYFNMLDSLHTSINVASLIGHNDIRKAVMGEANRAPTPEELERMKALVDKDMQAGAVGLSTGLIYIPGTYAKTDEIVALAKEAAKYNGVYTTHMRSEGDSVTEAIDEALNIGRQANIPVEISHFKVGGQNNWGRSKETLAMVVEAREEGLDVTIDQYPYTASSTSLSTLLPDWILADGRDSMKARLSNAAIRQGAIDDMVKRLHKRKLNHFSYAVVAYYKPDTLFNGKSIEEINLLMKRKHTAAEEAQTVIDMMMKDNAGMVFHGMSEEDVKYIMQYPYDMFACDASIRLFNVGMPHPRGYGTNARVLGKYVRDEKVISLEEAIRRMTSLPAQKFHFTDRGLLRPGFAADIVVFDANTVKDMATYEKPHQYSTGFKYVLVNGKITWEDGKHTGARNGVVLRNIVYSPSK
ncbi:MAG TPA: D-aminoacylase [Chitinophagaceae bacterium]|nr:D-aminoacylase [Chitinophagaceae bacterium]